MYILTSRPKISATILFKRNSYSAGNTGVLGIMPLFEIDPDNVLVSSGVKSFQSENMQEILYRTM